MSTATPKVGIGASVRSPATTPTMASQARPKQPLSTTNTTSRASAPSSVAVPSPSSRVSSTRPSPSSSTPTSTKASLTPSSSSSSSSSPSGPQPSSTRATTTSSHRSSLSASGTLGTVGARAAPPARVSTTTPKHTPLASGRGFQQHTRSVSGSTTSSSSPLANSNATATTAATTPMSSSRSSPATSITSIASSATAATAPTAATAAESVPARSEELKRPPPIDVRSSSSSSSTRVGSGGARKSLSPKNIGSPRSPKSPMAHSPKNPPAGKDVPDFHQGEGLVAAKHRRQQERANHAAYLAELQRMEEEA